MPSEDKQVKKGTKGQTMIYKTSHRKLNIDQNEPHQKPGVNSGALVGLAVPASLVSTIVLLLLQTW
jgi:hypothetical protein